MRINWTSCELKTNRDDLIMFDDTNRSIYIKRDRLIRLIRLFRLAKTIETIRMISIISEEKIEKPYGSSLEKSVLLWCALELAAKIG